jgi:hypothetical protein
MLRRATALYMRTGTFSSPKLIVPLQIALAIRKISLPGLFQPNSPPTVKPRASATILRPVLFELRVVGLERGG